MSRLDYLLKPKSIAIIGASTNTSKLGGGRCLKYLIDTKYSGTLFPINSKYSEIFGLKCYPNIKEIKQKVDLAVIAIPAKFVLSSINELSKVGTKSVVIFSSGFAENGKEGESLQLGIQKVADANNMLICGPNCQGFINLCDKIPVTISTAFEQGFIQGSVGLVTQSGAVGTYITALMKQRGIGLSYWISSGNEAVVDFADYLDYLIEDPQTNIIAGYLEGIKNGQKLRRVLIKAAQKGKPIILMKVGRTSSGAFASKSHTGAMTGSDEVYQAIFKETGVIRANGVSELVNYISLFNQNFKVKGNNIAIVTTSGGMGVLGADFCENAGIRLSKFTDTTKNSLLDITRPFSTNSNPLDIGAIFHTPEKIKECLFTIGTDENVDIAVFFTGVAWGMSDRIINELIEAQSLINKPIAVSWVAAPKGLLELLDSNKISSYEDPLICLKSVASLVSFNHSLLASNLTKDIQEHALDKARQSTAVKVFDAALSCGRKTLTENEGKQLLEYYEIGTPKNKIAINLSEALNIADQIGYPVALKVVSQDILHKTDFGAVKLNILGPESLEKEFNYLIEKVLTKLPNARIQGILVEEMIENGTEVIIGMATDSQFGKYIVFGRGGIFTEIDKDLSLRICPVNIQAAKRMIESTKIFKVLKGFRGLPQKDVHSLAVFIERLSMLATELGEYIYEIDLNPVMVLKSGAKVADIRVILK